MSPQAGMLQQPSLPLPRFSQPAPLVEMPARCQSSQSSPFAAGAAQSAAASSPLAAAAAQGAAAIAAAAAAAVAGAAAVTLPRAARQPTLECYSSQPGTMTMMSAPVLPTAGAGGSLLLRSGSTEFLQMSAGLALESADSSPTMCSRSLSGSPGSQCQEVVVSCACCKPVQDSRELCHGLADRRVLTLAGLPEHIAHAEDSDLPFTLQRIFGREGIQAIFGCASTQGARRLKCVGFNHEFMVELGGKLAKCIRPHAGAGGRFSEALEAERLRLSSPGLQNDPHAVFPAAAFLCQAPGASQGEFCCEILVFPYLEGCQPLGDMIRSFERSHPCGVLRRGAACQEHLSDESGRKRCAHSQALHELVRQAARLGRRFQALHGRRHGDFKADNVLLERDGQLRLSDFLSPFCTTCDADEFLKSLQSSHPSTQELQETFRAEWSQQASAVPSSNEVRRNSWLQEELRQLLAASKKQSLFGPMPDLLQGIAPLAPGGSPTGTMPAWFEPICSRGSSSAPEKQLACPLVQNGLCSPPALGALPSLSLMSPSFPGSPLSGSSSPIAMGCCSSFAAKPASQAGMPGQYPGASARPVAASPFFPMPMQSPEATLRLF